MESLLKVIMILVSISSLFALYLISSIKYTEFSSCDGHIKLRTTIIKTFVSKKGNFIGVSKEGILVFLNEHFVVSGDNVEIYGRAERFNSTCWIFPDKVRVVD